MKRFVKLGIALLAVCALACSLAACGEKDTTYAAAGTYKLVEIQSDNADAVVTADDVAMLDAVGRPTVLELTSGGTGTFTVAGMPADITWANHSLTMDGMTVEFTVSGDLLLLSSGDGATMVLRKQ